MTTQARTHWVFRVGDGQNFWNSSRYHIWGTKRNTSINPGDLMWFVTNNSNGHAIAVATFESLNERSYTTMTNEELGWLSIHKRPREFSTKYWTIQCGVNNCVAAGIVSGVALTFFLKPSKTASFFSEI